MKKWTYAIGILALGFVIFNNVVQTVEIVRTNEDYVTGLAISMIGSLMYGILNIKD